MALLAGACTDDLLYIDSEIGEGERDIEMAVEFNPLNVTSLNTRAPGQAIENISDVTVVAYDRFGVFYRIWTADDADGKMSQPVLSKVNVNMLDQTGATVSRPTVRATFSIKDVPFGRYTFYVVANCGRITPEMVRTPADLKNISLSWDNSAKWYEASAYSTTKGNAQLFGFFDSSSPDDTLERSFGFDAPQVEVSSRFGSYHSWLRRAASKVTLAFDPSGLKQGVNIYVKSVTIRDIPKNCPLGADNSPSQLSQLYEKGETFYYKEINADGNFSIQSAPEADYKNWLTLNRGAGVKGDHSSAAQALFFYENMQGDYSLDPNKQHYNKVQDRNAVGTNIWQEGQPDWKDNVKCGSYIEVEAYYSSINPENTTNGNIVYRFMLGQDVTYNYNSRRNHHYQLTLAFKGWANQPDWHINYEEDDPSLLAPETFLISYLYNQQALMPVKINGNCTSLKAEIVENNWAPYQNSGSGSLPNVPAAEVGDFKWFRDAYTVGPTGQGPLNGTNHPELGFLALRKKTNSGEIPTVILTDINYQSYGDGLKALKDYYVSNGQNVRQYNVAPGKYEGFNADPLKAQSGYNGYEVRNVNTPESPYTACEQTASACRMVQIPLWTRQKTMIADSGWSGNNPYEEFQRYAKVRLTATFRLTDGSVVTRSRDVNVLQVRRLVNPKGVWRSADNADPFKVTLMQSPHPGAHSFESLRSEGEWTAYVEHTNNNRGFLTLTGGNAARNDTIYGDTGTIVQFTINFNGTTPVSNPRCAIVNVKYHGGTAIHKILVRQGYETPMEVIDGGAKWSSFSLYSCSTGTLGQSTGTVTAKRTQSPLALGTFFKLRNYQQGLIVYNNSIWGPMVPTNQSAMYVSNGLQVTQAKWDNISRTSNYNASYSWAQFKITQDGRTINYKVPTLDDYNALKRADFAFGVVYSNGATATATDEDVAYGYLDSWNEGFASPKGMRACIVYNLNDARQILFPIGYRGMSRRTQFNLQQGDNNYLWRGVLRYSDVSKVLDGNNNMYRAINYNLPYCPGAIYWIDKYVPDGHEEGGTKYPSLGWDLNYFALHFSAYTANNLNDACPIKLIELD